MKNLECNISQRYDYNDIAKAIGMFSIIWGHIRLSGWSNAFVYSWHIPLFFVLSGMMFNKDKYTDFKCFLKKKVKSLLVPYVIFSFITWIIWALFSLFTNAPVNNYWMPLVQTFVAQGSGGFLIHNVPLWFVTCLFVMEIIYYFIADWKVIYIMAMTIALAICSYCMIEYIDIVDVTLLPWNLEVVFLGLPLFALGHIVIQKYSHNQIANWVNSHPLYSLAIVVVGVGIVFIGSFYNGSVSFGHADLKNPLITYPLAILGVTSILIVSMLIAGSNACTNNSRLLMWIKYFGRNSFTTMVIHNPIKGVICVLLGIVLGCSSEEISLNGWSSFIAFVLTLCISVMGMLFINYLKTRFRNFNKRA